MTQIALTIPNDQSRLAEVFSLYRKDSGTLGFMPEGAFEQALCNRRIIVATGGDERVQGYLFYRVAKGRAAIVHLCVSAEARGMGLARMLTDRLKTETRELECITLRCRRDYEVNAMWPRFGFVARGAVRGRGSDGKELTVWHFDHGHQNLFSVDTTSKVRVAMDTNIVLDLLYPDREHHEKANGLLAPWLDEVFELVVTPEVFNDVNRSQKPAERTASRNNLSRFTELRGPSDRATEIAAKLTGRFPKLAQKESGASDLKHLAYCVSAGVHNFVTRDDLLLKHGPELLQDYDVDVLTAVELISKHDSLAREAEYHPRRLLATSIHSIKVKAQDVERVVGAFSIPTIEKPHQFRSAINTLLASPRTVDVAATYDHCQQPIALVACYHDCNQVHIPLLRMASHPLAATVVRHVLMNAVRQAISSHHASAIVEEPHVSSGVGSALGELGFIANEHGWIKDLSHGFLANDEIASLLSGYGISPSSCNPDTLASLLWPAKPDCFEFPCYLVPIQAQWAEHFFDVELASMRFPGLSDIRSELHLGVEGVYYSASRNRFVPPGHILWYVTPGAEKLGTMTIKAVSRLRGVVRGGPKALFKQFHRLGVYGWKEVYGAAHKDLHKELVALRFSHTERFATPISKQKLAALGIRGNIQGPRSVPHSTFKEIYQLGMTIRP